MNQSEENGTSTPSLASHYALHVALQTMKERCQTLQLRLTAVEEENLGLRMRLEMDAPPPNISVQGNDINELRDRVGELTRQKSQLTDHISMVAKENRQLWSRLSKLTKDNQTLGTSLNKIRDTINSSSATSTHLIRSKTFTQNAPNPMLRHKMSSESPESLSLEEISLKVLNEFLEGKAEVEKKCTEIIAENNSLGFAYMSDNVDNSGTTELQEEIKKCITEGEGIKRALMNQQNDLNRVISSLKQRKTAAELCPTCRHRKDGAPKMADKNLSTDDEHTLSDESKLTLEHSVDDFVCNTSAVVETTCGDQTDLAEQKRNFDVKNKMCPMCGNVFNGAVSFDDFQDHVESHFIDDTEVESLEKNYEMLNSVVGNF